MANMMIIENKEDGIHGFKAFLPDWTCRPGGSWNSFKVKQYTCPGTFETDSIPSVCKHGMHFCRRLEDVFKYYNTMPEHPKVAEVIAWGMVAEDRNKCSTNKLEIIREIPWEEVVDRTNSGKDCAGICNTGDWNTGNCNTGYCNTGNCNTGNCNTGYCNTGNCNTGSRNTGYCNTGYCNTGDCNTGDWNTGSRNTGDWNTTNFSSGCFCTEEPQMLMFNKPSGMTYRQWLFHPARALLNNIPRNAVKWVCSDEMTDAEKKMHPTHETIGGYLKILDESEYAQKWWDGLDGRGRDMIFRLPNFNAEIFYQCTGIRVDKKDEH